MGQESKKTIKIILSGGGTGGSATPLLAIAEDLRRHHAVPVDFLFIGTSSGPERQLAEKENMIFKSIPSGKLRRYFSLMNFVDPFFVLIALIKSFFLILNYKPDLIITAGSFVSVPTIWAGWLLRVPVLVHQQDIRPGLANKMMAPFASRITVTFKKSLQDYGSKAVWTGNPVRQSLEMNIDGDARSYFFHTMNGLPVVLVLGGGTGAESINNLVYDSLPVLTGKCRIIHQTGKGKGRHVHNDNYKYFEFMDNEHMAKAFKAADIVVSRCGMGTLTEIAYFKKPAILIPMPDSHQEENAQIFLDNRAAIVLHEKNMDSKSFTETIIGLISDRAKRDALATMAENVIKPGAKQEILRIINELIRK